MPPPRSPTAANDVHDEEPPTVFTERTTAQLFKELCRELEDTDVVRVVDSEWLAVEEFRRDVDHLLSVVRRRGGRVEYPPRKPLDRGLVDGAVE